MRPREPSGYGRINASGLAGTVWTGGLELLAAPPLPGRRVVPGSPKGLLRGKDITVSAAGCGANVLPTVCIRDAVDRPVPWVGPAFDNA
ncbi:hypothetical protein NDU88_002104 [Pleurodeles waltl]|uniref:Uncharacterized protein n=1 Tax=Pleurodeles waltl TaxID=8319 RepID=A0AAV7MPJ9_PLEWA|nr:hypothetical protein NDU88_002104 [Pleurodeles waltl]